MVLLAPVTNWEPHGVMLAGYCYAMRHGMKVQTVTPDRVSHLQGYGVTVRGNVTSVYPPLRDQPHAAASSFLGTPPHGTLVTGYWMGPKTGLEVSKDCQS
jgi:hypothetical protein